jgi:GDP-L-fucose synthase
MENYSQEDFINVGSGEEISIKNLAEMISRIVGYEGELTWDASKPDGTPRKLMDSSRLFSLGWRPQVDLPSGIRLAYQDFLKKLGNESDRRAK